MGMTQVPTSRANRQTTKVDILDQKEVVTDTDIEVRKKKKEAINAFPHPCLHQTQYGGRTRRRDSPYIRGADSTHSWALSLDRESHAPRIRPL